MSATNLLNKEGTMEIKVVLAPELLGYISNHNGAVFVIEEGVIIWGQFLVIDDNGEKTEIFEEIDIMMQSDNESLWGGIAEDIYGNVSQNHILYRFKD